MALTAKEWLLLPQKEQERRKGELSKQESFLLRTLYSHIHFSEEEKAKMTKDEKRAFISTREPTKEEKQAETQKDIGIFKEMTLQANKD